MKRAGLMPIVFVVLAWASPTAAKEWTAALFNKTEHDFGVVARGANVEYHFTIDNIYLEDVHIDRISSTCGCTIPKITKDTLKTYETGELIAELDTRKFKGPKEATIRVVFDKPYPGVAELKIHAYIRSDVVFETGSIQFGSVRQGAAATQRVSVSYAGRPDWKIVDLLSASPYLSGQLNQVGRTLQRGAGQVQVNYELSVTLKSNTPPGYFKELLFVKTNDANPQAAQVPLVLEGIVVPALSVQPSPMALGVLRPGQTAEKNLILRGERPFRVVEITGPDTRFAFTPPNVSAKLQILPMRFTATQTTGRVTGKIRIRTDLPNTTPMEVMVEGRVAAETSEQTP